MREPSREEVDALLTRVQGALEGSSAPVRLAVLVALAGEYAVADGIEAAHVCGALLRTMDDQREAP